MFVKDKIRQSRSYLYSIESTIICSSQICMYLIEILIQLIGYHSIGVYTLFDDKSSQIILIGYHSIGVYTLFDPFNKKVMINRDMIIHELKEWDLNNNVKKDPVRVVCGEPSSETDKELQLEGDKV